MAKPNGVGVMIALKPKSGPPDLGGPNEPDADEQGGPPDNDMDDPSGGGEGGVKPEWVAYHTGDETCQNCEYMADGGMCDVLKMNVGPNDHCEAFEPKQDQSGQMGGQPVPMQPSDQMGGGGGQDMGQQ
jgi:hypothetical protein